MYEKRPTIAFTLRPQCIKGKKIEERPESDELNNGGGASARMGGYLCYINDNSNLAAEASSVLKRSCPHWEGSFMIPHKWYHE